MRRLDHPRRSHRGTILALVAMIAMVFAAVFGGVSSPPFAHHQSQPTASATTTVQTITTDDGCVVTANVALRNVVMIFVPGTGSTVENPPPGPPDMHWLDNGTYDGVDTVGFLDKSLYPAELGPGVGQSSLDTGTVNLAARIRTYDPKTTTIILVGGSQGAMVIGRVLNQPGMSDYDIREVRYSNPDTPGTGITARFPGMEVPTTGIVGGTPSLPTNVPTVSVSHEWDPMAYFPKYAWTFAFTLPVAALGFIFEHGDLGNIDYGDPQNTVTQDGDTTYVKLHSQLTPVLKPLLFAALMAGGPAAAVVAAYALKPLDDIIRPIIALGGQSDPGAITMFPTPQVFAKQLAAIAYGPVQALQTIVKLATGQPVFHFGAPGSPSPTKDLVDQANADDAAKNGTAGTQSGLVSTAAAPTTQESLESKVQSEQIAPQSRTTLSVTPAAKEDVVQAPQPQVADKNSVDNQGKDDPVPAGNVAPSQSPAPLADQPKAADQTAPKPADSKDQSQASQKDGDQSSVPKADVKSSKSGDAPKDDTKSAKGTQKGDDDSSSNTSPKRNSNTPKQGSNGKKDSEATKPNTPVDAPKRNSGVSSPSRQTKSGTDDDGGKSASSGASTRHQPASKAGDSDGSSSGAKPTRAAHAAD